MSPLRLVLNACLRLAAIGVICTAVYGMQSDQSKVALAQGADRSHEAQDMRRDMDILSLERRVSTVESLHPEALAQSVKDLAASVEKQQNVLIALVIAVVANLIASFPAWITRKRQEEPSGPRA